MNYALRQRAAVRRLGRWLEDRRAALDLEQQIRRRVAEADARAKDHAGKR